MLTVISPAKTITNHPVPKGVKATQPEMLEDISYLVAKMKKLSARQIKSLMGVSADLANLNYERYQNWKMPFTEKNAYMAAFSFDGTVYWGLDAKSLNKKEVDYAQSHLRILSGLYGILKPTDLMTPYRLEMGTRMKVTASKTNLYKYWEDRISDKLEEEMNNNNYDLLLNLASNEYFKAVNTKKFGKKIITPQFRDESKGEYKSLMTYAKKARGLMARYVIKHKVSTIKELKNFDYEGYVFNARLSEGDNLIFTRDKSDVPAKLK